MSNDKQLTAEETPILQAKKVLNKYVKGDVIRDYSEKDLQESTIFLSSALNAMLEFSEKQCQIKDGIIYQCELNSELDGEKTMAAQDFILELQQENARLREAKGSEAVEFAEWLRTFEVLNKENNQWVMESQITSEKLYQLFLTNK